VVIFGLKEAANLASLPVLVRIIRALDPSSSHINIQLLISSFFSKSL